MFWFLSRTWEEIAQCRRGVQRVFDNHRDLHVHVEQIASERVTNGILNRADGQQSSAQRSAAQQLAVRRTVWVRAVPVLPTTPPTKKLRPDQRLLGQHMMVVSVVILVAVAGPFEALLQ